MDASQQDLKNALLKAMHHGGTISRARRVENAPFRITVRGDQAMIPAGIVHELIQSGALRKQDYPDRFFYTLSSRGAEMARRAADVNSGK